MKFSNLFKIALYLYLGGLFVRVAKHHISMSIKRSNLNELIQIHEPESPKFLATVSNVKTELYGIIKNEPKLEGIVKEALLDSLKTVPVYVVESKKLNNVTGIPVSGTYIHGVINIDAIFISDLLLENDSIEVANVIKHELLHWYQDKSLLKIKESSTLKGARTISIKQFNSRCAHILQNIYQVNMSNPNNVSRINFLTQQFTEIYFKQRSYYLQDDEVWARYNTLRADLINLNILKHGEKMKAGHVYKLLRQYSDNDISLMSIGYLELVIFLDPWELEIE